MTVHNFMLAATKHMAEVAEQYAPFNRCHGILPLHVHSHREFLRSFEEFRKSHTFEDWLTKDIGLDISPGHIAALDHYAAWPMVFKLMATKPECASEFIELVYLAERINSGKNFSRFVYGTFVN